MRRLALLTVVFAACCGAAEYVHLKNGVKLEVDRHEEEGNDIWLYTKSGFTHMDRTEIAKFEPILPPGAPLPMPTPAPKMPSKVLAGVDPNSKAYKLIDAAAAKHGIPAELIHAVAQVESAHRQDVRSRTGAIGIMQLMPGTARQLGANPNDAAQNVDAGARFLRDLLIKYQNNPDQIALALAAYNAGPNAVDRYRGVPPYQETQMYVERVINKYFEQGKQ